MKDFMQLILYVIVGLLGVHVVQIEYWFEASLVIIPIVSISVLIGTIISVPEDCNSGSAE